MQGPQVHNPLPARFRLVAARLRHISHVYIAEKAGAPPPGTNHVLMPDTCSSGGACKRAVRGKTKTPPHPCTLLTHPLGAHRATPHLPGRSTCHSAVCTLQLLLRSPRPYCHQRPAPAHTEGTRRARSKGLPMVLWLGGGCCCCCCSMHVGADDACLLTQSMLQPQTHAPHKAVFALKPKA